MASLWLLWGIVGLSLCLDGCHQKILCNAKKECPGTSICAISTNECVEERCTIDQECGVGNYCEALTGRCIIRSSKCGDGNCTNGETCTTCPADCTCPAGQLCQQHQCQAPPPGVKCGDSVCQIGSEDCGNCPQDCPCKANQRCEQSTCQELRCGDGQCNSPSENCENCPQDCGCSGNLQCQQGECKPSCGNGTCDAQAPYSENCDTCPQDCACKHGCQGGVCLQKATIRFLSVRVPCGNACLKSGRLTPYLGLSSATGVALSLPADPTPGKQDCNSTVPYDWSPSLTLAPSALAAGLGSLTIRILDRDGPQDANPDPCTARHSLNLTATPRNYQWTSPEGASIQLEVSIE